MSSPITVKVSDYIYVLLFLLEKIFAWVVGSFFSHLIRCLWFSNIGILQVDLGMSVKKEQLGYKCRVNNSLKWVFTALPEWILSVSHFLPLFFDMWDPVSSPLSFVTVCELFRECNWLPRKPLFLQKNLKSMSPADKFFVVVVALGPYLVISGKLCGAKNQTWTPTCKAYMLSLSDLSLQFWKISFISLSLRVPGWGPRHQNG